MVIADGSSGGVWEREVPDTRLDRIPGVGRSPYPQRVGKRYSTLGQRVDFLGHIDAARARWLRDDENAGVARIHVEVGQPEPPRRMELSKVPFVVRDERSLEFRR